MAQHVQPRSQAATDTGAASPSVPDAELRLDLCPSANVSPLADAEFEVVSYLTDIPQSALRLIGDQRLPLNELVCVELSDHLILADVKQCEARGNKFTIDAARLVTLPKSGIPGGASKSAKIDALVADFHLQCQLQLPTLQAS